MGREFLSGTESGVFIIVVSCNIACQGTFPDRRRIIFNCIERMNLISSRIQVFIYAYGDLQKRQPVSLTFHRGISYCKNRLCIRSKEYIQRPSAASALRLHEMHHVLVNVGPLLAVDFDADIFIIQVPGCISVRKSLCSHHMTPVAG